MDAAQPDLRDLSLTDITLDPRLQMREAICGEVVADYALVHMQLPPAKVILDDDGHFFLWDGHHTYQAKHKMAAPSIKCAVTKGTFLDALLLAAGANRSHGRPRTPEDKRIAVTRILTEEMWQERSDRWIADACGVSHPFVAQIRIEIAQEAKEQQDASAGNVSKNSDKKERVAKDGAKVSMSKRKFLLINGTIVCKRCARIGKILRGCLACVTEREKAQGEHVPKLKRPGKPKTTVSAQQQFQKDAAKLTAELGKLATAYMPRNCPQRGSIGHHLDMIDKEVAAWVSAHRDE